MTSMTADNTELLEGAEAVIEAAKRLLRDLIETTELDAKPHPDDPGGMTWDEYDVYQRAVWFINDDDRFKG